MNYSNELFRNIIKEKSPCYNHYINWLYGTANPILIFDDVSFSLKKFERPTAWQILKKNPLLIFKLIFNWFRWSKHHINYEMRG